MPTWRLLKRADNLDVVVDAWLEVGTHQSEHDWSIGYNAASEIGAVHGKGEYLLLNGERCKELAIGERSEFFVVEDEEPEVTEPVSLKAAPSAAEVMQRDG